MAEPLLYSEPTLDSDRAVQLFGESLYQRPELAKHVRTLMIPSEHTTGDEPPSGARTNNGFRPIPWALPNLRTSEGVLFASISPQRQLMLHSPPPSLVTLRLECRGRHDCGYRCLQQCVEGRFCLDGSVFNGLPLLEHLDICGCIVRGPQDAPSVSEALPRLKRLRLRLEDGENWAVQCLSAMRYVVFNNPTFFPFVTYYLLRSDYVLLRRCFCKCTISATMRRVSLNSSRSTATSSNALSSRARFARRAGTYPCSTTVPMSGHSRSTHTLM